MVNKKIKNVKVSTYHGGNLENFTFTLNGFNYYATREWDSQDKTIRCVYGRDLPNEYYDTIRTLKGETEGMNNISVSCIFNNMPDELYEEIKKS